MQNLQDQKVKTPKGKGTVVSDGGTTVNVKLDDSENMPNYFAREDVSPLKKSAEKKVEIEGYDFGSSSKLAIGIQRAWGRMLIGKRYPQNGNRGTDGTTFEFGVFVGGLGFLQGETWSPVFGLPAQIAELGGKLQEITKIRKPLTPDQEEKLIKELSTFEELATKP